MNQFDAIKMKIDSMPRRHQDQHSNHLRSAPMPLVLMVALLTFVCLAQATETEDRPSAGDSVTTPASNSASTTTVTTTTTATTTARGGTPTATPEPSLDDEPLDERIEQPATQATPESRLGSLDLADERLTRNRKSASQTQADASSPRATSLLLVGGQLHQQNSTGGHDVATESSAVSLPTLSSALDYDDFDLDYQLKLNTSSSPLSAEFQSPFLPESQPLITGLNGTSDQSAGAVGNQLGWLASSRTNASAQYLSGSAPILPSLLTVKSTQLTSQELDKVRPQFAFYPPEDSHDVDSQYQATEQSLLAQGDLLATASNSGAPLSSASIQPAGSVIRLNGSHVDLRDHTPSQMREFQSAIARLRPANTSHPPVESHPMTTIVVDSQHADQAARNRLANLQPPSNLTQSPRSIPAGYYAASVQRQPASPAKLVAASSSQHETYSNESAHISDEDMSTYVAQLASFSTPLAAAAALGSGQQKPMGEPLGSSNWVVSPSAENRTENAVRSKANMRLEDLEQLVQQLIELSARNNKSSAEVPAESLRTVLKASPTRMLISSPNASASQVTHHSIEPNQRDLKRERNQAATELMKQVAFIEALRSSITRPFNRQMRPDVSSQSVSSATLRPTDDEEWQSSNTTETVAIQSAPYMPSFGALDAMSDSTPNGLSSVAPNGGMAIGPPRGQQMSPQQTLILRTPTGSLLRTASMLVRSPIFEQQQQVAAGLQPTYQTHQQSLFGSSPNGYVTRPSMNQATGSSVLATASSQAQSYQFDGQTPGKLLADRFPLATAPAYLIKLPTLTGGTITAAGSMVPPTRLLRNRPLRLLGASFSPPRLRLVSSGLVQPSPSSLSSTHQLPPYPLNAAYSHQYPKMVANPAPSRYQAAAQQADQATRQPYNTKPEIVSNSQLASEPDSVQNQNANLMAVASLLGQQQQAPLYHQTAQSQPIGSPQSQAGQQQAAALSRLQQATYSLVELTSLASLVDEMVGGSDLDASPMVALAQAINNLSQQNRSPGASLNTQASTTSGQSTSPVGLDGQTSSSGALSLRGILESGAWREKQPTSGQRDLVLALERLISNANRRPSGRIRVKYVRVPVAVYESSQADGLEANLLVPTKNQLVTKSELAELVAGQSDPLTQQGGSTTATSQPSLPETSTTAAKGNESQPIQSAASLSVEPASHVTTTKATSVTPPQGTPGPSSSEPTAGGATQASSKDYMFDELGSEQVPQMATGEQATQSERPLSVPMVRWNRKLSEAELKAIESAVFYSLMGAPSSSLVNQLAEPATTTTSRDKRPGGRDQRHSQRRGRKGKIILDDGADDLESAGSQSSLAGSFSEISGRPNGDSNNDDDDRITSKDLPIIESLISSLIHGPKFGSAAPAAAPYYHPYAGYPLAATASQPYPALVPYLDPYWRPAYLPAGGLRAEPSTSYGSYAPLSHHHHVGPLARPRFSLGEVMGALGARKLISSLLSKRKRARNSKRRAVQQASGANRIPMVSHQANLAGSASSQSYLVGKTFLARHFGTTQPSKTTTTSTMSSILDVDEPAKIISQPLRVWYPTNAEHELTTTPSSAHRPTAVAKRASASTKSPLGPKQSSPSMGPMQQASSNCSLSSSSLMLNNTLTPSQRPATSTTTTPRYQTQTQVPVRRAQLDQEILIQSLEQTKKLMTLEPKLLSLGSGHRKYRAPQLFTNNHNKHSAGPAKQSSKTKSSGAKGAVESKMTAASRANDRAMDRGSKRKT